ncbi:MAG: RNA-binding protein [Prolixibacteraceae bacterium]|jgi:RNA recognition motif-containing protein|nr:RNA-binding protein [Prolixibacteraceae bacterium]
MDIFVAKLNSETNADHLTELFGQYGTVSSAKVIMDRDTGMSKCFGFVEMEDEGEGNSAIENLNESNFMGNDIVVKKSEPRPQEKRSFGRSFNGGGGGGGGRRPEGNRRFDNNRYRDSGGGGDRRSFNRGDRDRDRGYNRYE